VRKAILFYNTMWGMPLDYAPTAIPAPYTLTTERAEADNAVAIVFHLPTLSPAVILNELTKKKGQLWVAWSMESELNYPKLSDPALTDRFDLTMTYRLDSDVVAPYLNSGFSQLLRTAPTIKEDGNLLNAFISSSFNRSRRIEFVLQLMSYIEVHSYGRLLQNRRVADDAGRETKLDTIKTYKFTLALENAIAKDYVTEKFYDPLVAGSVPVYLGAPNIEDFAPGDKCFINTADWESPAALARHLVEIAADDAAYAKFFAWKTQPFRPQFSQLMERIEEHPFVRLCKKVDERLRQAASGSAGLADRLLDGACR